MFPSYVSKLKVMFTSYFSKLTHGQMGSSRGHFEQLKDICNEENFTVWIESEKRFGNCFYLTLFGYLPAILFTLTSVYFLAKPSYGFHHAE